jgi:hypothetical protein
MLSIASWRSGAAKAQEPAPVEKVAVRRAVPTPAPTPKAPLVSVEAPPVPTIEGEHRGSPRLPASAVPLIRGLTFSPFGAEATLINISATGLLAECGAPLKNGNVVKAVFEGAFAPRPVEGRVVRTCVVSMAPDGVRYSIGVAFKTPIDLGVEVAPQSHGDSRPAPVAVADLPEPADLVNRW